MATHGCAFIIALLLAISVPASDVTALETVDTSQALSPEERKSTDLQQPSEEEASVMTGCQLSCKNRYLKEVKKCRQSLPSTFKRHQCIKRANYFGRTCRSFCKSKYEDTPQPE